MWEIDNLIAHIAALALIVDNYSTDPFDLVQDLNLEPNKMYAYYMELGCKVTPMKAREREVQNLKPNDAKARKVARLELPLEFPKQRGQRKNARG
jgi:DNA-directed RNA polymerase I subunit RPA49